MYRLIILLISLLFSNIALSQTDSKWKFSITPILWNASVEAKGSSNSGASSAVSSGVSSTSAPGYSFFTLDNLSSYLSLKLEADYKNYGILFDSLNARYEDSVSRVDATLGSTLGFIELAARYRISNRYGLDLIAGLRRSFIDIDFTLTPTIPILPAIEQSSENVWTDPIIGLRYQYPFSDNWHAQLRGDIGGFNVDTERMVNLTADLQYLINRYISLSMGYRYLSIDFKDNDILSEVTLNGWQIGLGIHF